MAARRLLIVLLILLGVSTLAALIAPPRPERSEPTKTTAKQALPPLEQGAAKGRLLQAKIDADRRKIAVVPLRAGDQLALRVRSKRSDQVEIPAFGEIQAVSRDAPASFDLLLEEPGVFAIRLLDAGRVIGRLEVSPEAPPASDSQK